MQTREQILVPSQSDPAPQELVSRAWAEGNLGAGAIPPEYLTQSEADALYKALGYIPDWAEITNKPATFAPSAHKMSHATGGADAMAPADIGAAPSSHVGAGGTTQHPAATTSTAGFHSAADKAKIDALPPAGEVVVVQGESGQLIPTGGVAYKLQFISDAANIVDVGTFDYTAEEWIAPRAGTFWLGAMFQASQGVDGAQAILDLYKNGVFLRRLTGVHTGSTRHIIAANAVPVKAALDDRFSVWVTYNGGSGVADLNVNVNTYFYGGS